jgi:hypothetical protein
VLATAEVVNNEKLMYQPRPPLIELSPRLTMRRLSEVELGRLLLAADAGAGPGFAIRGDVLTERGDIIEGLFRLHADRIRFERRELDERVVAIETAFVLEAELDSITRRAAAVGDLLLSEVSGSAGVLVAGPWTCGEGLLDLASAVARPRAEGPAALATLVASWRLVAREERSRVIFRRYASEPRPPEPWRELPDEDGD